MNRITAQAIFAVLGLVAYGERPFSAQADMSALWDCKDITINQVVQSSIAVGERLDYEIRIRNEGSCELSGSSVVDFIPRLSIFDQASPQPTEFPAARNTEHPVSKVEWKNVTLGPGKELFFRVSAFVRSPEERVLLNTVCFENPRSGRVCSQAETTVTK